MLTPGIAGILFGTVFLKLEIRSGQTVWTREQTSELHENFSTEAQACWIFEFQKHYTFLIEFGCHSLSVL